MVSEPFESTPSPSASIVILPPDIVMEASDEPKLSRSNPPPNPLSSFPPAALNPSLLDFRLIVPPEISTSVPSIPS